MTKKERLAMGVKERIPSRLWKGGGFAMGVKEGIPSRLWKGGGLAMGVKERIPSRLRSSPDKSGHF
jgi:hypothetical protein